jgi:predicted site-specific integrase-resolvase
MSEEQKTLTIPELSKEKRTLFTDKEAAEYLRISQVTLWRERKAGKITFRRIASKIVYLKRDIDEYLERGKRQAFAESN